MVLGFAGMGNMAKAMLTRVLSSGIHAPDDIIGFDIAEEALTKTCSETGIHMAGSNIGVARQADIVILAVKPDVCGKVLSEISPGMTNAKALVSIVLGWTTARLRDFVGNECQILRVMPNTPAMVGEGMTVLAKEHDLSEEMLAAVMRIFELLGRVRFVSESEMDAATGLSGSGSAYVYLFIEALADGGVRQGLPREDATVLAAQTVLGAAKMVLETGLHPGTLKDAVCSPGGSTIEGVTALEKRAMRAAVIEAVSASAEKSAVISQNMVHQKA